MPHNEDNGASQGGQDELGGRLIALLINNGVDGFIDMQRDIFILRVFVWLTRKNCVYILV